MGGADTLAVNYRYDLNEAFLNSSDDEQLEWIGQDAQSIMDTALSTGKYERITVVGKSLGTVALGSALSHVPELRNDHLIWLTPSVLGTRVREQMRECSASSFVAIGTADPNYSAALTEELEHNGTTLLVPIG